MADRRKLAQGLMMMTPAMREDLAGREQDIQRGKTVELLRRAGKEMYENPIVNTAIGFTPGVGDVQAAGETFAALQRGAPWQETAGYAVGMLPFVPALRTTWHGSPHGFTKFDMSKIGTGEGAQAYGHGLYLAESPDVAKGYKEALSNPEVVLKSGERISNPAIGTNEDVAKAWLEEQFLKGSATPFDDAIARLNKLKGAANNPQQFEGAAEVLNKWKNEGATVDLGGYLYKVDLPDEQIAKMLDWDKPLSEQPHVIKFINDEEAKRTKSVLDQRIKTLESMGESHPNAANVKKQIALLEEELANPMGSGLGTMTGGEYFDYLRRREIDPKAQAEMFMQQGIPGIQYLDQASRGAGEGTRNYVVFSDEIPQILERNGQPIAQALREYKQQFPEGMLGKTGMFETGTPVSFEYIRNTEKSPYMGEKFGQDIEPAGRYLSYKDPVVNMESMPNTWETGQVSFNNPLVVNFGEGYGTPTNWKKMVSESFGGKTGKDLSKAIAESGYDGIVTVDKYGTSEIVDLSNFIGKQK